MKPVRLLSAFLCLLSLTATLRAQAPGYTDWNAGRDLIINEKPDGGTQETANPNATVPQWSYGYRTAIESTALTLYTAAEHHNSDGSGFEGFDGGPRNGSGTLEYAVSVYPALGYPNLAADEIYTSIDTQSPNGNNVIRWTCPAAGTYSYRVTWRDIDAGGGDGAAGYVVLNGVQRFKGTWPNGNGQGAATTGTIALKAGDVFDVVLNANSADSSYDSTGTRVVIVKGGTVPPAAVNLPLTAGADNKLDAGFFPGGAKLTLAFTGTGDLVDARLQIKPDGSLAAPATGGYEFFNQGASYPTANGGDGINHYPGGGANYDNTVGLYGFAGSTLTDTTAPGTIRLGAVVGTFSANPARGDWFLIGNGATVTVPTGGAHLYVAVNDDNNTDNHGTYAGTLAATGGTAPIPSDWDAGRDFALNENNDASNRAEDPNALVPQWSYGYRTAIESGDLTLFAPADHLDNFGNQSAQHGFVSNGAGVSVNTGTTPVVFSYCCGDLDPVPPGDMALDANNPAYVSVVRWTAPAAGTFTYSAAWLDLDPYGGNGAGGYVVVNGKKAFGQTWDNGSGKGASTTAAVDLQAGDTIDFVLDDKGDGNFDTTRFNATVVPGSLAAKLAVTDSTASSSSDTTGQTAIPGDKLTYGFTVRNTGNADATHVVVKVALNGVKFKSASDNGTLAGSFVTYDLGTLAAGTSRTLTLTTKLSANFPLDGRIAGVAISSVTADAPTAALTGLSGLNSTVVPPYQLNVASYSSVSAGDVLTYHFTFENKSKTTANNVFAVVRLPEGVKFVSAYLTDAAGNPIGGSNAFLNGSDDVIFNLGGSVPAGNIATFDLNVRIPYDAAPGATVALLGTHVIVDGTVDPTNSTVGGGTSYAEPGAVATVGNTPAANPPKVGLAKVFPTGPELQALFALKPAFATQLQGYFPGTSFFKPGTQTLDDAAVIAFGKKINPYLGQDQNDDGSTVTTIPAPNTKQPAPYLTVALFYTNTGGNDATNIVLTDRVPEGFAFVPDAPADPANLLPAPYALINGVPATPANLVVIDNGRTVSIGISGKLKPGKSGLVLYQVRPLPVGSGGNNVGATVSTTGGRLASASLDGGVTAAPDGESLLITGPVHFAFDTVQPGGNQGAVGSVATFVFAYYNDGGKKVNDFSVTVPSPAGGTLVSAKRVEKQNGVFVPSDSQAGVTTANNGAAFAIGKVKPGKGGFVQVQYKITSAVLNATGKSLRVLFQPAATDLMTNALDGPPAIRRAAAERVTRANPVPAASSNAGLTRAIDPSSPRVFIQRTAPQSVAYGKPIVYTFVVGNLGDQTVDQAVITDILPVSTRYATSTGTDAPVLHTTTSDGRQAYTFTLRGIAPHAVRTVKLTLQVSDDATKTGTVNYSVVDDSLYVTSNAPNTFPVGCPSTSTRILKLGETTALAGEQIASGGLGLYGLTSAATPGFGQGVNAGSMSISVGGADLLTTNGGVAIVPLGGGGVLASGPSNLVAAGAGNVVSNDGNSLVAAGAGNLITISGLLNRSGGALAGGSSQLASALISHLISNDGSGLIAAGAGNIVRAGGGNIISEDGTGLISNDGSGLLGTLNPATLITDHGSGVFATGLANILSDNGLGLISDDGLGVRASAGGNLVAAGAGNILAAGGGNIISDNSAGVLGSSSGTSALVAAGAGNLIAVGGGNVISDHGLGLTGQ